MKRFTLAAGALAVYAATGLASAYAAGPDIKIALIAGKTGILETYAKETETGFMMGLEYLTGGKMEINGRKIKVIVKDDQSKPDLARTLLAEAYGDDKADIAVGTSNSGAALAMLPVAAEYKKILVVEPAVADSITGDKWNRYIFRTARSSMQESISAATTFKNGSIGFLAQDYAFGKDTVKAFKEALGVVGSKAKVVAEEYASPATTDFTAPAQRLFDKLKDAPQPRVLSIVWAGPHPMNKIAEMHPERYGISIAPNGNILPVLKTWKNYAGTEGTIFYYYDFPKNKMNDWFVAEHRKRFKSPPDMFSAGGFAAASAVVTALTKSGGDTNTEKLIKTMEGMDFETPKGKMNFRAQDHQAMQSMYHFRIKKAQKDEWDLLELVREIPASELPVPVKNKK
ncbi:ABC transporter permease [Massilia arenosa]|uniref:ABC transporter permease n=1 Tax=Zemynaea arenosa TaxID=2561931 RepID=A0A4Y9SGD0_9BURK|nr:substrate-binding domain-containing protein [Massilia arenosa]TFW20178.1 ABC transporter permease [Massilia arenosa]